MRVILIFLLLVPIVSSQVVITPNMLDVDTRVNEQKAFNIIIENGFDFVITDLKFDGLDNYGFSFNNVSIDRNSTRTIELQVKTTESIHETINTKLEFSYFVELSEGQKTVNIDITEDGLTPKYVDIHDGDSILWSNKDSISHTLFSPRFDGGQFVIAPNGTYSKMFTSIEQIDYYDPYWTEYYSFHGTVNILNKTTTEKAHNPNYDVPFTINLNSVLNPTTLTAQNSKNNYEIEYTTFKKGLLTLTNTGNETAEIIELSSNSDWVTFNKNDFNILPGEIEWVEYTITPVVFSTNATDKTYTINLNTKATNSETIGNNISVFIPHQEIVNDLGGSDVDTMNWLMNVYCPRYPTSFLCNQSVSSENGSIIYRETEVPINVSELSWYEMKKDIAGIQDSNIRSDNQLKLTSDKLTTEFPIINQLLNETYKIAKDTQNREKRRNNTTWILGFFVFLGVLVYFGTSLQNKKRNKQGLMEETFNYRR